MTEEKRDLPMTENIAPPAGTGTREMVEGSTFSEKTRATFHDFKDLLEDIGPRYAFIVNVLAEMKRVARGKPVLIRDDGSLWRSVLSERDMVIIDLNSWAEAIDPFLRKFPEEELVALRKERPRRRDDDMTALLNATQDERHAALRAETFARLLPTATGSIPTRFDLEKLRNGFDLSLRPLKRDRNDHRAHKTERAMSVAKMAKALDLAGVREALDTCERLVRDVYLLTEDIWWSGLRLDVLTAEGRRSRDADDAVDIALFRTISFLIDRTAKAAGDDAAQHTQRREALYAKLHELHDAKADPNVAFNDLVKEL
jgi:hypothetical protein